MQLASVLKLMLQMDASAFKSAMGSTHSSLKDFMGDLDSFGTSSLDKYTKKINESKRSLKEVFLDDYTEQIEKLRQRQTAFETLQAEILEGFNMDSFVSDYGQKALDAFVEDYYEWEEMSLSMKKKLAEASGKSIEELRKEKKQIYENIVIQKESLEMWTQISKKIPVVGDLFSTMFLSGKDKMAAFKKELSNLTFNAVLGEITANIKMQGEFSSATYRATGTIKEHVSAVNDLRKMNTLGSEVNLKAYKEVIETGLQYGENREELIKLTNTHVLANKVMGISTQEAANFTKSLTGFGVSAEKVEKIYGNLANMQANFGISSQKMSQILNKTSEASSSLVTQYGKSPKVVEGYAMALANVQAQYSNQAKYLPVVEKGLTDFLDRMTKASVASGDMLTGLAMKMGADLTDPVDKANKAAQALTTGPMKVAFEQAFAEIPENLDKATKNRMQMTKDAVQGQITGMLGISKEMGQALYEATREGKQGADIYNRAQEIMEEKKRANMTLEERAAEARKNTMDQFNKSIEVIMASFAKILQPVATVLEFITSAVSTVVGIPFVGWGLAIVGIFFTAKKLLGAFKGMFSWISKTVQKSFELGKSLSNIKLPGRRGKGGGGGGTPGGGRGGRGGGGKGGGLWSKITGKGKGLLGKGKGLLGKGKGLLGKIGGKLGGGLGGGLAGLAGGFILDKVAESAGKDSTAGKVATVASGALSGAGTGAMIGSFLGPLGTLAGGAIGGLIGGVSSWFEVNKEADKKKKEEDAKKEQDAKNAAAASKAAAISSIKRKSRIEYVAERYGVDKQTAQMIMDGKFSLDQITEMKKQADLQKQINENKKKSQSDELKSVEITGLTKIEKQAADSQIKISEQKNKSIEKSMKEISTNQIADQNKLASATGDTVKSLASIQESSKAEKLVETNRTNSQLSTFEKIGNAYRENGPILGGFFAAKSLIGDIFESSSRNVADVMGITKSFMGGGGIFSIFTNLFKDSSQDKNEELRMAVDKVITVLINIGEQQKKESSSIKSILSTISSNTEPRTEISTIWR